MVFLQLFEFLHALYNLLSFLLLPKVLIFAARLLQQATQFIVG